MVAPEWVVQHPHSAREPGATNRTHGIPPSAAQTRPWPRPGRGRVLWPEARSSESAVPRSHPCTTGTAAPEPKRSGDPPHAPWFVPPTHGASAYPRSRSRRIPCRLHQPEFVSLITAEAPCNGYPLLCPSTPRNPRRARTFLPYQGIRAGPRMLSPRRNREVRADIVLCKGWLPSRCCRSRIALELGAHRAVHLLIEFRTAWKLC